MQKKILSFIFIWIMIFGSKIGGLDLKVFASFIIIIIKCYKSEKILFSRFEFGLIFIVSFIGFIAIGSLLINLGSVHSIWLRYFRLTFSLIGIIVFLNGISLTKENIIDIVSLVILTQALTVIISAIYPEIQLSLATFSGFDKAARLYRSTGFCSGFDISGFILNMGLLLSICRTCMNKKNYLFEKSMFFISIVFSSRVSIVLLVIIIMIGLWLFVRYKFHFLTNIFCALLCICILFGIAIFSATVEINGRKIFQSIAYINNNKIISAFLDDINFRYSSTDANELLSTTLDLSYLNNWIIGDGIEITQDSGYSKILYSTGISGFILSVLFYLRLMMQTIRKRFLNNHLLCLWIIVWIIMLFVLNFKNNYFFTRNISEFGLLIFFIYYKKKFNIENNI